MVVLRESGSHAWAVAWETVAIGRRRGDVGEAGSPRRNRLDVNGDNLDSSQCRYGGGKGANFLNKLHSWLPKWMWDSGGWSVNVCVHDRDKAG